MTAAPSTPSLTQELRYCKSCVLPNTRPRISFNAEGLCCACESHRRQRREIDWKSRQSEFREIVQAALAQKRLYDCIIPVSGGKDSTWQVLQGLEAGLKILAVTWKTPGRTELGRKNLDNLIARGVDHIDFSINPRVERVFMYKSLLKTGSTAVPMHLAIYALPIRLAVDLKIPLVLWGENPHMEYGGTEEEQQRNTLDHRWLRDHGILQGTRAEDWIDAELSARDLAAYSLPSEEEFRANRIQSLFLGYYFPWDPETSRRTAEAHGFQAREEGPRTGFYNYADIDCDFISVHHHFKWLKFGFTRLFDNLALEIRHGRMTRETALDILRAKGDQTPYEDIRKLCGFLNITLEHFHEIEEKFRNREIWIREKGRWKIKNFLLPDWPW